MGTDKRRARLSDVQTVLLRTLLLNLSVAGIKIAVGALTGIAAILADGLHSVGDGLSNVVGLLGIRLARREPDEKYPYGYEKFESIATLVITGVIFVTFFEVVKTGIGHLLNPRPSGLSAATLVLLIVSMVINLCTIWYEGRAGRRLSSELLIADSNETKGDVVVTWGILTGVAVMTIWPSLAWLDGVLTLLVAVAIGRIIWEIVGSTARILGDAQVVDPHRVHDIVMAVPGARFCHAIRSRGRETGFYLDLHLGVDTVLTIEQAHDDVCHRVKVALHDALPELKSANIHIEPDNENGRGRRNSVFVRRDPYGFNGHGL